MRRFLALFLIFMALVCTMSCNNESVIQTGTLVVEIDSSNSRGIQAISMETASYNVRIKNSSDELVFSSSSSAETSYVFSVPVGTYTVEVDALNSTKDVIGFGSTTGIVYAGQENNFTVTVKESTGTGSFNISISANDGYELSYSIKDATGTEVAKGELVYFEESYSATIELNNGFYSFSIKRNDTNVILKSDTVRIIKGRIASYEAEFLIQTDGSISVINEILQTPQISLELSSKSLKADDSLTASATITGISNYTCYWAVDEVAQSDAKAYSDLELSLTGLDAGTHTIALFVSDGNVVWAESSVFFILPEQPAEIEVAGDVELWFVGDVLIPWDFQVSVKVGDSGYTFKPVATHGKANLGSEPTHISIQSVSDENYYAYLDYRYDGDNKKTVVYITLDKFIENPGYLEVVFPDFELEDNESKGVWFDADTTVLNPNASPSYYGRKGLVTVINDTASRVIKVEPDTYRQNGTSGSYSPYYDFSLNRTPFVVLAGETKQSTWEIIEYTTIAEIEVPDVSIYPEFAEMADYISFHVGENEAGGWSNQYFPDSTWTMTTAWTHFGENLPVIAEITLKDGVSESAFPYMIVPDVATLTVEEGNTYSVKYSVVEKPRIRLIVQPVESELASSLEGTSGFVNIGSKLFGWGELNNTDGWDYTCYVKDFKEGDILEVSPWQGYMDNQDIIRRMDEPTCRLIPDKNSITISTDEINVITIQVLPLE